MDKIILIDGIKVPIGYDAKLYNALVFCLHANIRITLEYNSKKEKQSVYNTGYVTLYRDNKGNAELVLLNRINGKNCYQIDLGRVTRIQYSSYTNKKIVYNKA